MGAYDDYKKIKKNNSSGVSSKFKIIIQIILALIGIFIINNFSESTEIRNLYFPFFKNLVINLGWFFIPFYLFILVGSSNAVNLTDGLDGLATVPVLSLIHISEPTRRTPISYAVVGLEKKL